MHCAPPGGTCERTLSRGRSTSCAGTSCPSCAASPAVEKTELNVVISRRSPGDGVVYFDFVFDGRVSCIPFSTRVRSHRNSSSIFPRDFLGINFLNQFKSRCVWPSYSRPKSLHERNSWCIVLDCCLLCERIGFAKYACDMQNVVQCAMVSRWKPQLCRIVKCIFYDNFAVSKGEEMLHKWPALRNLIASRGVDRAQLVAAIHVKDFKVCFHPQSKSR